MAAVASAGLGIGRLREYWERKTGRVAESGDTWPLDMTLLSGLRLNVLEVSRAVREQPSLEALEAWVLGRNGGVLDEAALDRLRRALDGETVGPEVSLDGVEGLTAEELAHWDEQGYVVLRGAVTEGMARDAEAAIYRHLGMSADDPESWYGETLGHSIWVPLLRDPAFWANRRSPRMVKAFAQLYGREDLWVTVDQGGLNPPEREGWPFPGPHLHWDTTIAPPHHLGVQGILYLADVAENQGAFSCVPGFHRTLQTWLDKVPAGKDAREYARETLTMKPIAGKRGDMVLWHQSLPHGASPNTATRPRVAQYISMWPTECEHHMEWR